MSAVIIQHPGTHNMPTKETKTVEFDAPPLGALMSYRVVHALCTVVEGRLRVTHYTICLAYGPEPIWGVWTINGKFLRFYGRKSYVAEAYPNLVWRTKQSTWSLVDIHDKDHLARVEELKSLYKINKSITGQEVAKVLSYASIKDTK